MRIAVALGFLAAAGCNQIYGLEKTSLWDAPPDAPFRQISIHRIGVGTDPMTGAATAPVKSELDDLVAFHAGKLGEPLVGTPTMFTGGEALAIADDIFQTRWRLVLQRRDQAVHELQFPPFAEAIELTFPRLSRVERAPIPGTDGAGAGVGTSPTGYTTVFRDTHEHHRIYTTGIWSATDVSVNTQFQLFFACATGMPGCRLPTFLDGAPAAPEVSRGDRYVAIDLDNFGGDPQCRHSVGSAGFAVDLVAGQIVKPAPEPGWRVDNTKDVAIDGVLELGIRASELGSPDPSFGRYRIGYVPSDQLPAFTSAPGAGMYLSAPLMLELLSCGLGSAPAVQAPNDLENRFAVLAHAEAVYVQTLAGGAKLANGIAATTVIDKGPSFTGQILGTAPFADDIRVGATALPRRGVQVAVPQAELVELTFAQSSPDAEYWDVLLHEVTGATKQLVRLYTIPNPDGTQPITVDLRGIAGLTPGREYVFELRSYTGRPGARMGNFAAVAELQSMAVVHSATFVVQ